jgi:hypothetical protein
MVDGNFDQARCGPRTRRIGGGSGGEPINPDRLLGQQTVAWEISEDSARA